MIIEKTSWHYKFLENNLVEVPETLGHYLLAFLYIFILFILVCLVVNLVVYLIGLGIINIFVISMSTTFIALVLGWITVCVMTVIATNKRVKYLLKRCILKLRTRLYFR